MLERLGGFGLEVPRVLPATGCGATARHVYLRVNEIVHKRTEGRVWVESVKVWEHGGDSAPFSLA